MDEILTDTVSRLFHHHFEPRALAAAESGTWPASAWSAVEEAGLPRALLTEAQGGYGIDMHAALGLLRLVGEHAVPLPVAETMLAAWLLGVAGLPVPDGPLSFATGPVLERQADGWRLTGSAARVPWGRQAAAMAVCAVHRETPFVALVLPGQWTAEPGRNMAGEPRDTLHFDVALNAASVAPGPDPLKIRAAGAASRSLMMAGAMTRISDMTVRYAQDRVQFGRPIGKFQAIQQSLAALAGQAAAAVAAGDIARDAMADGVRILPIACAKARAGEAAGLVAGLAHQVHGAIGFTYEHSLHFFTKRLWSWRDEYGGETEWSALVGRHMAQAGPDRLWAEITSVGAA